MPAEWLGSGCYNAWPDSGLPLCCLLIIAFHAFGHPSFHIFMHSVIHPCMHPCSHSGLGLFWGLADPSDLTMLAAIARHHNHVLELQCCLP